MEKTKVSKEDKKKILDLTDNLFGVERIKAYQLADRGDLAKDYANELLEGKCINPSYRPSAFSPYKQENWEVLRRKNEFDDKDIQYDENSVKKGLINTYIEVYDDERLSEEGIKTIENILENFEVEEENIKEFLTEIMERGKNNCGLDEIYNFCLGLKETGYSNLAEYQNIPRGEVVNHYLDNLFLNDPLTIDRLSTRDLSERLSSFIKKEEIDEDKITSRAVKTIKNYKEKCGEIPGDYSRRESSTYFFVKEISKIQGVEFPKETILEVLEDYIENKGELNEAIYGVPQMLSSNNLKDEKKVRELREKSLRNEIEKGSVNLGESVKYGINNFGFDFKKGWLKESLKSHLDNFKDKDEVFELKSAIYIAEEYELLSKEKIKDMKEKLKLIELIKS